MNPYLIIVVMAGYIVVAIGGFKLGSDHEVAAKAREDKHIAEAVDAANTASATAIETLKPIYTTIQGKVIHETSTNTVYADCHQSPDGLRLVNQALSGGTLAPSDSKLPAKVDAIK